MDLRTSQTIKLINKHLQIRKYLTKFCYLFIIGGIFTYIFYAIIKTSEKYKLVSDLANNASHYKTEKIMINPRINFQHTDNKIYEIANIIHTNIEEGMMPLDKALAQLVQQGLIERSVAENYVLDPDYFMSLLG